MSPPLRWEGGWCINAHGERLYAFHVRHDAGRITRMNPKPGGSYAETLVPPRESLDVVADTGPDLSRARRARRIVVDLSVTYQLNRFVTLTYQEEPDVERLHRDLRLYVRRLRHRYPNLGWIAAMQRGAEKGRPHIHMLLPTCAGSQVVSEQWHHGLVDVSTTRSIKTLRKAATYLCHDFDLPAEERLTAHRYFKARHLVLEQSELLLLTMQEMNEWITANSIEVEWYGHDEQPGFVQSTGYFRPHELI